MKKNRTNKILLALAIGIFAAAMFALAGCAGGNNGGGTLSSDIIEETGAFKVAADNADANASVTVGGAVELKEGDVLLVSPDLQKGKLRVKLLDASNNAVFDEVVSGRVLDTYEVDLGEYTISVDCAEGGTTGSLIVTAINADEFEQQGEALAEELAKAGVSDAAVK